ncbi:MAG: response regulator [Acetivibrio sp.]
MENRKRKDTRFQTKNVHALVVDDNEVNLMIEESILKQYGIQTDVANSGTLALQLYYNNEYDIIFMDYLMPDMDGIETTKRIYASNKESKNMAVIALSANITCELQNSFIQAGAKEVLEKPMEIQELSRILKRWLPKEKIAESILTGPDKEKKPEIEKNRILNTSFYGIKELKWEDAIERMGGNPDHYVKVLKVSRQDIAEQILIIENSKESVDKNRITMAFHSLKGIFANIGAETLMEESKKMEETLKNWNPLSINDKENYVNKVVLFSEQLKKAEELYTETLIPAVQGSQRTEMNEKEYEEKMNHLKELIVCFAFNESKEQIEEIMLVSAEENRKVLETALKCIQNFSYEEALKVLEKIGREKA